MSTEQRVPAPPIVSQQEWHAQRLKLLTDEKELTQHLDRVRAQRRRLPMVKVETNYTFDGPQGKVSLLDLFQGRRQLVIYHFMFDPEWQKGCMGCSGYVDAIGDLSMLKERNTTFAVVSRAPLAKLQAYKATKGWDIDWYSSFGSDFNYDFHVTLDEAVAPIEYNYRRNAGEPDPERHEGRGTRPQRVLPHRRRRIPHLFDLRPRYGESHRLICTARRHALWTPGRFRGLTRRLAAEADVRLTALRFFPSTSG
jgi:predicted dithiol-disulfide oxidoreductase (DUF899 family)